MSDLKSTLSLDWIASQWSPHIFPLSSNVAKGISDKNAFEMDGWVKMAPHKLSGCGLPETFTSMEDKSHKMETESLAELATWWDFDFPNMVNCHLLLSTIYGYLLFLCFTLVPWWIDWLQIRTRTAFVLSSLKPISWFRRPEHSWIPVPLEVTFSSPYPWSSDISSRPWWQHSAFTCSAWVLGPSAAPPSVPCNPPSPRNPPSVGFALPLPFPRATSVAAALGLSSSCFPFHPPSLDPWSTHTSQGRGRQGGVSINTRWSLTLGGFFMGKSQCTHWFGVWAEGDSAGCSDFAENIFSAWQKMDIFSPSPKSVTWSF